MNKIFERIAGYTITQACIAGIVFGAIYYFFMYNDGTTIDAQIRTFQDQIRQEEVKKRDTENALKEEALIKESVGRLSQQFQEVSRRLPTTLFSIDISKSIDMFVQSSGVNLKSKKPGTTVKKDLVDEVPVSVIVEGGYSEIAQFIYQISSAERLTRVKNFVITPLEDKSSRRLRFEGQIVGYKLSGEKKE